MKSIYESDFFALFFSTRKTTEDTVSVESVMYSVYQATGN